MNIEIIIEPGVSFKTLEQFKQARPPFSIAVDGYARCGPIYEEDGPYRVFNHHDDVSRDDTLSSCAQALVAVRKRIYDCFRDEHGPLALVHLNDIDPDATTTGIILRNPHLVIATMNPLVNRLVDMVHHMDMANGMWPYPPYLESLETQNWIFERYWTMRMTGALDRRVKSEYQAAFSDMERRFMDYLSGRAERLPLQLEYDVVGGGPGWSMVHERGAQARLQMLEDNIHAFGSARQRADGRWVYTFCRHADYIRFPIPSICAWLNREEQDENSFGGGNNIIGNAYGAGSLRPPDVMVKEVNAALTDYRQRHQAR